VLLAREDFSEGISCDHDDGNRNVTGSTGYVFSSRDLSCVYLTKEGASQAYDGKIRRFGLDLGTTKPGHVVWKVHQLGGLVGDKTSTDPKVIAGNMAASSPRCRPATPAAIWPAASPRFLSI
jgi:hypothetical protein